MVTLWIGDFRTIQLQNAYKAAQQTAEYHYITEDRAEYSWFINGAIPQLPSMSLERANIIVMLGFVDCVYSCVWSSFKANTLAEKYAKEINSLVEEYPNFNIYACTVPPIDGDYPFVEGGTELITKSKLTEKIKLFNKALKTKCTATVIDCYDYLIATSFTTRDGVRYVPDTCTTLHNYIKASIKSNASASFLPRLEAPNQEVDSFLYWTPSTAGGASRFTTVQNGSVLPSCTAYAWGRFYEIIGEEPKLSTKLAKDWWSYKDGYQRGQEPRVGAIACWASDSNGYVAVVEQVKDDGSIITSESDWNTSDSTDIWRLRDRVKGDGNWGLDSGTFQGFIYCPFTTGVAKDAIWAENKYNSNKETMKPNAQYIYSYLSARGWTVNAVAGLLGNLQVESGMSPAIWESLVKGSNTDGTLNMTAINAYYKSNNRYPGFGLVQWTPYSKFTDWCATNSLDYLDIDSQLKRIDYEVKNGGQWQSRPSKGYDLTFDEFISSTRSASWLAEAFAFCYERPASSTGTAEEQANLRAVRGANGDYWYNYLSSLSIEVNDTAPKINSFKIDKYSGTEATISFLPKNCNTAEYLLLKGKTKVKSGTLSIKSGYKVINLNGLAPNTEYTLKVEAKNEDGEAVLRELSFTTEQDLPSSATKVELSVDRDKSVANSRFTLKITKPGYLGYWKANSGYDIQLIVNNKVVKTIIEKNATKDVYLSNFTLKDKFNYTAGLGDNIQVGVRVWVKDSSDTKIYDNTVKTTASVYLLNKPIKLYITK